MGKVIKRIGQAKIIDGCIYHNDQPSTHQDAERLYGRKLDRRKSYAIIRDDETKKLQVCECITWTHSCSGCFETGDYGGGAHLYPYDDKAQCHIGAGCRECGFMGKVRTSMWMPLRGYL